MIIVWISDIQGIWYATPVKVLADPPEGVMTYMLRTAALSGLCRLKRASETHKYLHKETASIWNVSTWNTLEFSVLFSTVKYQWRL